MHQTSPIRIHGTIRNTQYNKLYLICEPTYNELFVADGGREVAVKGNTEVVRVISLICNNMLQQGSLMSQNLGQSGTMFML